MLALNENELTGLFQTKDDLNSNLTAYYNSVQYTRDNTIPSGEVPEEVTLFLHCRKLLLGDQRTHKTNLN